MEGVPPNGRMDGPGDLRGAGFGGNVSRDGRHAGSPETQRQEGEE